MGLILVKIDNTFILKETSSYGGGNYRIDGKDMLSFSDIKRYQFDHAPVVETVQHKREIDYYEKEGEGRIALKDFEGTVKELRDKHVDEDGDWNSIDAEFAYRKWREGWVPVYKEFDEYTKLEVPVVSQRKSDFKDIVPMYQIGLIEDPLCQYDPTPTAYIREFAKEMGLEEEPLAYWGNHSGGKELKLYNQTDSNGKGTYKMFLGQQALPIEGRQFKGTYEECVAMREEVRGNIRRIMQRAYDEQVATLTQDKAQVVLASLRAIRGNVASLNVYAKEHNSKRLILEKIDNTIDTIAKSSGEK